MKWLIVFVCMLTLSCIAFADDPFKVVAKGDPFKVTPKWVDPFKPVKSGGCVCSAFGFDCGCHGAGDCICDGGKAKMLPTAPKHNFAHDCGCPSLPCNCGAGGCHCSENRQANRQPAKWFKVDSSSWSLFRGNVQIGGVNSDGVYMPYDEGSKTWGAPCKLPQPLPKEQTMLRVQATRACST